MIPGRVEPSIVDSGSVEPKVVGILLAAGQSRRFGSDKRLSTLPSGQTMLQQSLGNLLTACDSVWVCLSDQDSQWGLQPQLRCLQQERVHVHLAEQSRLGMGHSLSSVVQALLKHRLQHPSTAGVLIALADMPFIQTDTLHRLASSLRAGADRVAPFFGEQRGHPAGFSTHWLDQLAQCRGDTGARHLLNVDVGQVLAIQTDDPGILLDIDVPTPTQ
jgi:molybdenum cofactor cytidylyltransferase